MRIEQLRCIVDIAETGSLTATAQRQFITQQAVSKTIKQLEKELDATLLIRTHAGVSFTESACGRSRISRTYQSYQTSSPN